MFVNELRSFIIRWNKLYPIDYVWRKKYNIPFGSDEHRKANFIDMLIDFEEEEMVKAALETDENDETEGILSEAKKSIKVSRKELDYDFNNLDISKFNDKQKDNG